MVRSRTAQQLGVGGDAVAHPAVALQRVRPPDTVEPADQRLVGRLEEHHTGRRAAAYQVTERGLQVGGERPAAHVHHGSDPGHGAGRAGSHDFKVSIGAADKSLIEFKLASNSHLKRNLEKQVEIYEKANQTATSVKVIICYTARDQSKVTKILKDLNLNGREDVVVIDARSDNKPSASTA